MSEASPIPVWVVEDNRRYRQRLARGLNRTSGLACPRDFGTVEEVLAALQAGPPPRAVLLDLGLPGLDGIAGLGLIRARVPGLPVVILTVFDDHDRVFRAICAGASGYLLKTATEEEITLAVRGALDGGVPMNPHIARRVLDHFVKVKPPAADYGLTDREREILEWMVEGLIKKEIAARLKVSYHTVDFHLRNIYRKLHVTSGTEAVAKAVREGLV